MPNSPATIDHTGLSEISNLDHPHHPPFPRQFIRHEFPRSEAHLLPPISLPPSANPHSTPFTPPTFPSFSSPSSQFKFPSARRLPLSLPTRPPRALTPLRSSDYSSTTLNTTSSSSSSSSIHDSSTVFGTESVPYRPVTRISTPPADDTDLESASSCPEFHSNPWNSNPEHFRDISFLGPITLHRLFILLWVGGTGAALYFLQNFIWPPNALVDINWSLLGIIWLIPLPSSLAFFVGALWFRYNTKLDMVEKIKHNVAFRIVSRGINPRCLLSTIRRCQREMRATPMFPYLIEIVTDGDVFEAPADVDVIHLKVPPDFRPPNGARFKARALHYACEYSVVPGDTWIVHLDEESQLTSSGIKGIAKMIGESQATGNVDRVGQGMILYHRGWKSHPFLTLADMRRTGDDLGHFFLQHSLGFTIFGLHGSFVVVRQDKEAAIGFDVGERGSITEDAWWILLAMERGYRTVWVDGYLEEQATQSMADFMKQRRRWYVGLLKVGLYCPVKMRYRILLMLNTLSWVLLPVVMPLQMVYLGLSFAYEKQILLWVRLLSNFIFSTTTLVYLSGLVINMREHGTVWWRGVMWVILQLLLMPLFFFMEVASILLAFFSPFSKGAKGFHVVKKSGSTRSSIVSKTTESVVAHASANVVNIAKC